MRSILPLVLAAAAAATAAGAAAAPRDLAAPPLVIASCQVMSGGLLPQRNQVGLAIRFTNTGSDPLSAIVVRAKYGSGWVDFEDDGKFAPHLRIDNFLAYEVGKSHINWVATAVAAIARVPVMPGRLTDVHLDPYLSLDDPENCSIMRTVSENGKVYTNPNWPRPHSLLPTPAPDFRSANFPAETGRPSAPVAIAHCQVTLPGVKTVPPSVWVVFKNIDASRTADRIVFRGSYGTGALDFADKGTFSREVVIKHLMRGNAPPEIAQRAFLSFDDAALCQVVTVHYTDGSSWNNPQLPATAPSATPVPGAIRVTHQKLMWTMTPGDPKP